MSDEQPEPEPAPPAVPARRGLRRVLLIAGPLLVLIVGAYLYYTSGRYVDTANAYVKADKVMVSAQVSGPIATVAVHENEHVTAGEVLFRLDRQPLQIAVAKSQAHLDTVRSELEALQASYAEKQQELGLAQSNAAFSKRELERQTNLIQRKLVSQASFDAARHNYDVARRQVGVIRQDLAQILANLDGDATLPVERHSRYLEAEAQYRQAVLDLQHAAVRAPFDGIAGKAPEPGDYVKTGDPVMSIVADSATWVEANYKETQLTHVRPGQAVTVHVDTYPNRAWHGRVASISQATGAEFSILPPQNASGNWVKVVQWVPVRIALDHRRGDPPLRAGMSTEVTVDTGYHRPLPGVVKDVAQWFGAAVRVSEAKESGP